MGVTGNRQNHTCEFAPEFNSRHLHYSTPTDLITLVFFSV